MPCINAVTFHENPSLEAICRTVCAAGFDTLEVSRPPFYDKLRTPGTRQRFAAWAHGQGLRLRGFDCWVEVDPYQARQETLEGFRAAVDWAADLGLGLLISHDPWAKVNAGRAPTACLVATQELFRPVADWCAAKGLTLVFEPHPDTLSIDNAWAIDFVDGLGRDNVGLVYDCCHYGVGQPRTYVEAIRTLGHRIRHLHVADGDAVTYALHLALGDGVLDLDAIVAALRSVGFAGTVTNDLYGNPLPEEAATRNAPKMAAVEHALGVA